MNKKKCIIAAILIAVFMGGSGATLGYLMKVTETKSNVFSSSKTIAIQLREEAWDGYSFEDLQPGDGSTAKDDSTSMELGINQAANYVPGQVIPKDPMVKNSGDETNGVAVYVGLKVQYFDETQAEVDYDTFREKFLSSEGIEFDKNWTLAETEGTDMTDTKAQYFVYTGETQKPESVEVQETTTALFTEIPLSMELAGDGRGMLPEFQIRVTAYAIQSDNIEPMTGQTQLLALIAKHET